MQLQIDYMHLYERSMIENKELEKLTKLQNENKYLKNIFDEETKKLKHIIRVLNKEIEFYKDNSDILKREIKDLKKTQRRKLFTA